MQRPSSWSSSVSASCKLKAVFVVMLALLSCSCLQLFMSSEKRREIKEEFAELQAKQQRQEFEARRKAQLSAASREMGEQRMRDWAALDRPVSLTLTGKDGVLSLFADQAAKDQVAGKRALAGRVFARFHPNDPKAKPWSILSETAVADESRGQVTFAGKPVAKGRIVFFDMIVATSDKTTMVYDLQQGSLQTTGPSTTF